MVDYKSLIDLATNALLFIAFACFVIALLVSNFPTDDDDRPPPRP